MLCFSPHSAVQIKTKGEKKKDKFFTMDPTQISFDMVRQKLKDIVMTRGKRGVDRNEQVEMLTYLATVAKGPVQKLEVLIQVVSALFDINPSMSTHMSIPLWKRCAGTLLEVLQTLADNDYIEVDEMYDNPEERTEEPPAGQPAKVSFSPFPSEAAPCCHGTCYEHTISVKQYIHKQHCNAMLYGNFAAVVLSCHSRVMQHTCMR